jgi:DNA polymerase III gamma/tau subunit
MTLVNLNRRACIHLSYSQLEEGLQQARLYAAKPQREQAKNLARDSLELLDQIVTYWPDKINNTTVGTTLAICAAHLSHAQ